MLILLAASGALLVTAVYFPPIFLGVIGVILNVSVAIGVVSFVCLAGTIDDRRRMGLLADERRGESICSFARSFDYRSVDTWVIRAVFEELQPWCRFGSGVMPLRANDQLAGILGIVDEDLDELARDVAHRAGRSLESCSRNPYIGKVKTVSDLVQFLVNQPLKEAS